MTYKLMLRPSLYSDPITIYTQVLERSKLRMHFTAVEKEYVERMKLWYNMGMCHRDHFNNVKKDILCLSDPMILKGCFIYNFTDKYCDISYDAWGELDEDQLLIAKQEIWK